MSSRLRPVRRPGHATHRRGRAALSAAALTAAAAAAFAPAAGAAGAKYVALGDSYSSGDGVTPYLDGTNNPTNLCHRSQKTYGALIAKAKGYSTDGKPTASYDLAACSGGTTHDLFETNFKYSSEPAQLSHLGADTKLVTMTIGGNDLGLTNWLQKCLNVAPQWLGKPGPPTNMPGVWGCTSNAALGAQTLQVLDAVAGVSNGAVLREADGTPKLDDQDQPMAIRSLSSILTEINRRSPQAKIYVAGYPNVFGTDKARWTKNPYNTVSGYMCDVTPPTAITYDYLDATTGAAPNYLGANNVAARYGVIQKAAVAQAVAAGIPATFVDPQPRFTGHANCDTLTVDSAGKSVPSQKWIEGISPTITGSFHPSEAGQNGYAQTFLATPGFSASDQDAARASLSAASRP